MAEHLETAGPQPGCRLYLFLVGVLGQYSDPMDVEVGASILQAETEWHCARGEQLAQSKGSGSSSCYVILLVVQSLTCVQLFATPQTAARQASLSFTTSQSLIKLLSIESVMPSNPLTLCRPLLLLPSVFPSIRVFSKELALRIRWPKH